MIKIVFGTSNKGKLKDVLDLFPDRDFELLTLGDLGISSPDIEENGDTFEANALIKYNALRSLVPDEYILVTEDSGLEIDALNGEPGVKSRRWNPESREMSDEELIQKTLLLLQDKPDRKARFVTVMAFGGAGIVTQTLRGELIGEILNEPKKEGMIEGLPYRALFYVPVIKKMLYEIHDIPYEQRKNCPTHREQVWLSLIKIIG